MLLTRNKKNIKSMSKLPWYKDGLKFACTGCGKCCTGTPGIVFVSESEMQAIADQLNISLPLFKRKYVRHVENRYALIEKRKENHSCIFFKNKKCEIYQSRPIQCRTYPFWPQNLRSGESWEIESTFCEGINDHAPLISLKQIEDIKSQEIANNR